MISQNGSIYIVLTAWISNMYVTIFFWDNFRRFGYHAQDFKALRKIAQRLVQIVLYG